MKKIMIFAAVAAATLAFFSCTAVVVEQDVLTNDVLVLSVDSGEMDTRADVERTFENEIDHFDFFFFSDAEGTTPIPGMHGHVDGASTTLDTQEGATYAPLRAVTSYVYILANYPDADAIDHSVDWTLADLLALEVDSPILTERETELNPITNKMEETGNVTFADCLVMDSWSVVDGEDVYTTELTPAAIQEQRTVTVPLARLAAKVTVDITVVPSVTIDGYVWKSHPELLQAYYVNALNNKATVDGTPVRRSEIPAADVDDYKYETYPTAYKMTPTPVVGTYTYTTKPFYTYPQEWTSDDNGEPYIKIQMPWLNDNDKTRDETATTPELSMGSTVFYYKVTVPKPDTDGKWTLERNKWYKVGVTLSMLNSPDEYADLDFTCSVYPWSESGWKGGTPLSSARFFDVPVREFTMYSEEELAIPYSSSSTVTAYFEEISYWYYGTPNGTHYEFLYDPENVEAERYSTLTLPTDYDSHGTSLAVQDAYGANTNAARDRNQYKLEADGKAVNFTHALSNIFTVRTIKVLLVNEEGRTAEVIITQHPAIEVRKRATKNAFLDGRFNLGEPEVCDKYGNLIGAGHTTSYISKLYYYSSNPAWSSPNSTTSYYGSLFAGGSTTVASDHYFTTEVSVSAFTEDNNTYKVKVGSTTSTYHYRLGDPRVTAESAGYTAETFTLPPYMITDNRRRSGINADRTSTTTTTSSPATAEYAAWEEPLKILIGSQNESDRNVIAPRFLVSSSMNITGGVEWNTEGGRGIVQRCAMYQENGYPAGRWRLPTEAEFAFMMRLQGQGNLPMLFANCYYRMADGRAILVNSNNKDVPLISTNLNTNHYIRMVYDLWYWGDDPLDGVDQLYTPTTDWELADEDGNGIPNWKDRWADYYHPNMHEH